MDQHIFRGMNHSYLSWYEAQLFIAVICVVVAIEVLSWKVPPVLQELGGEWLGFPKDPIFATVRGLILHPRDSPQDFVTIKGLPLATHRK